MDRTNRLFCTVLRRGLVLFGGLVSLFVGAVPAHAESYDPKAGDIRATLLQRGTVLRKDPKPLAAPSATLPYATVVRVDTVQSPWVQVTAVQGATGTGWLPASQTVEPRVVLDTSRPRALASGASQVTSQQVSTAGRQWLEGSEKGYRGANPRLEAFYPQVDRIEEANRKMDLSRVAEFARRGRLGR